MMKKYIVFALALLVAPAFAQDQDSEKASRGERKDRRAEMIKKYDKDGDGKLSDEEKKAMMEDRKKAREAREKDGEGTKGKRGSKKEKPEGQEKSE